MVSMRGTAKERYEQSLKLHRDFLAWQAASEARMREYDRIAEARAIPQIKGFWSWLWDGITGKSWEVTI